MEFWMLSGTTLISLSTTFLVYAAIRLFLSLAFIIGVIYFGAKMNQEILRGVTKKPKSRFVSLGIGWSPRKEERRKGEMSDRRQSNRIPWTASVILAFAVGIVAGRAMGYKSRDAQLNSSIMHMPDTLIVSSVYPDGSRDMLDKDGRKFGTKFCIHGDDNPNQNDLTVGNKLKQFDYIQRADCKEIRGYGVGYVAYSSKGVRDVFPIPKEIADAR